MKEVIKRKIHTDNATICFQRGFETLPKAEKLTSDVKRNRKTNNNNEENFSVGKPAKLLTSIEYPNEVTVLQNASRLALVTEPKSKVTEKMNIE